jgi:hypothetical protein
LAQLVGLQLLQPPWLQPPPAQVWQASPPAPQAASVSPGWQVLPAQQPPGQLVPSQTQAPPTQRCPLAQGAPAPQAQLPAAEQLSARTGSQGTQATPALPQASRVGALHAPAAQQPSAHDAASQAVLPSIRQSGEQPSPATRLPSSHSSMPSRTTWSPQIAGCPSVRVTLTSSPRRSTTACWLLETMAWAARPSTRRTSVRPA